jgi:site-specific recombinase XerD
MNTDPFTSLVQRFFADFLTAQRSLSPRTVAAYRDTFRLFLTFLSTHHGTSIDSLTMASFSAEAVLAFLDHLERERKNSVQTRNVRLAAIRAFARFAVTQTAPDFLAGLQRILSVPMKRTIRRQVGFLSREEVAAILGATAKSWSGRRDHLLFTILYNTGARVSEALDLRPIDINGRSVNLRGKGRKLRSVPLWPKTLRSLQQWCQSNQIGSDQPIFNNRRGTPLSRDGVAYRLILAVRQAEHDCSSLAGRQITPHVFRHTTAMHLLQAGVPLEVIALWLGHENPGTTHLYVDADLKMKKQCLQLLDPGTSPGPARPKPHSHLISFLEAL